MSMIKRQYGSFRMYSMQTYLFKPGKPVLKITIDINVAGQQKFTAKVGYNAKWFENYYTEWHAY